MFVFKFENFKDAWLSHCIFLVWETDLLSPGLFVCNLVIGFTFLLAAADPFEVAPETWIFRVFSRDFP